MPQLRLKNRDEIGAGTNALENATKREAVISRIFDAPRGRVFKAWTDPKHMAQWWGPKGFTNPTILETTPEGRGSLALHTQAVLQGAYIMVKTQGGAAIAAREHR